MDDDDEKCNGPIDDIIRGWGWGLLMLSLTLNVGARRDA